MTQKRSEQTVVFIMAVMIFFTACLAATKMIAGHYGHSHTLFADGVHSIADLIINGFVLVAFYYGAKQADHNHPYGHGRIETMGTLGLALLLIIAGLGIMGDAAELLLKKSFSYKPDVYVLAVAIGALILNEGMFRYALHYTKKHPSPLMQANAWHIRSDVAVSAVVLLGIVGSFLGFTYLDAIGAVFIGLVILKMGGSLLWQSSQELIDTGVDQNLLTLIRQAIVSVPGVRALHLLRTRRINQRIFLDVHVLVAPRISVSEGHFIGDQVMVALKKNFPDMADITVHVDPEDDEKQPVSALLMPREALIEQLKTCFAEAQLPFPQDIRLHYLNNYIDLELFTDLPDMPARYRDTLDQVFKQEAYPWLRKISIFLICY